MNINDKMIYYTLLLYNKHIFKFTVYIIVLIANGIGLLR